MRGLRVARPAGIEEIDPNGGGVGGWTRSGNVKAVDGGWGSDVSLRVLRGLVNRKGSRVEIMQHP